jgi:hypothetical protein
MPNHCARTKNVRRRYWLAGPIIGLPVVALMIVVPQAAFAATGVPLGTAASFGVLAATGITNTGVTTIQGDTGSLPTDTATGFGVCTGAPGEDCVTQNGTNYTDPASLTLASAKAAVGTAYGFAAGQSGTSEPVELGGRRLVPGVYKSGTFGMTGTLTLDGRGDHGAVFIFQTTSTLITNATARVLLINGAQECNVFWQVGSSATLAANTDFTGTIDAADGVSVMSGVTVHGRLFAETAAVTLIHDTIVAPGCNTTNPAVVVPPPTATATATPTPGASVSAAAAANDRLTGRSQVTRVPAGAVQSGDGSMSRPNNGAGRNLLIAGLVFACVAVPVSARRLRRRPS